MEHEGLLLTPIWKVKEMTKVICARPQPFRRKWLALLLFASVLTSAPTTWAATTATTDSGVLSLYFHPATLANLGMQLVEESSSATPYQQGGLGFALVAPTELRFNRTDGHFKGLRDGTLHVSGDIAFQIAGTKHTLNNFTVHVAEPWRMELRDASGTTWFILQHMQQHEAVDGSWLRFENVDIAIASELAMLLGRADLLGSFIGAADMEFNVVSESPAGFSTSSVRSAGLPDVCSTPFDVGFTDVALTDITTLSQLVRTPGDRVAVAPGATLKNIGTSSVEWFNSIAPDPDPGNHPFLSLNLYRLHNGRLQQIGQGDVKHAFFTINTECECAGGNILYPTCADTYGTATNANRRFLAPREEINALTGDWESQGSHFDGTPANNFRDHLGGPPGTDLGGHGEFEHLLTVAEADLLTPGARYFIEAWYLVRDDINIFNGMGHKEVTPGLVGDTFSFNFVPSADAPLVSGSILDSYVSPSGRSAQSANVLSDTADGRFQLAYQATLGGNAAFNYEFALMNHDYDRGVRKFSVPLTETATISNPIFLDNDNNPANDWVVTQTPTSITWEAPPGSQLEWGTLYNFGFSASASASGGSLNLQVQPPAGSDGPIDLTLGNFVAGSGGCISQPISIDSSISGNLSGDCLFNELVPGLRDGSTADLYQLTLTGPGTLTIDMNSPCVDNPCTNGTVDSFLFLYDETFTNQLAMDDDGGQNVGGGRFDSHIEITLEAGTYFVLASSFGQGETGAYSLTTQFDGACLIVPLELNTTITGEISDDCGFQDFDVDDNGRFVDAYSISIVEQGVLSIRMTSPCTALPCEPGTVDSFVGIVGTPESGVFETSDDEAAELGGGPFDSRIDITLQPGDYLVVSSTAIEDQTGNYSLTTFFTPTEQPAHELRVITEGMGRVSSAPFGIACGSDCSELYPANTQVTLTATAEPGFAFAGWQDRECTGIEPCVLPLSEAITVNASFTPLPSAVTSYENEIRPLLQQHCVSCHGENNPIGGIGFHSFAAATAGNNAERAVARVNDASFPMPPSGALSSADTNTFTQWQAGGFLETAGSNGQPDPVLSVRLSGNGSVTSDPTGVSCNSQCSVPFPPATTVALTATPAEGFVFSGWTGDCIGSQSCVVNVGDSSSVTAVFNSLNTTVLGAVLPVSRAVQVNQTATAFATVINAGSNDATGC